MSDGRISPSLIIRTSVGSERPLFPGHQHIGNYSEPFRQMLKNTDIVELHEPEQIYEEYQNAFNRNDGRSTILVEFGDFYNEK